LLRSRPRRRPPHPHRRRSSEVGAADFVVEAVRRTAAQDPDLRRLTTSWPGVVLATNTSSLSITLLAAATRRPEKVIGMHFMNPVPVMKLVEVIPGQATAKETTADTLALAQKMGKTPVLSQDLPGFISNRILMPMINEAIFALYEGVGTREDIDTVMTLGMRHPMGPLALADFIGLDTCLAILEVLHQGFGDPKYRPARCCAAWWRRATGRKSGRFYDYGPRGRALRAMPHEVAGPHAPPFGAPRARPPSRSPLDVTDFLARLLRSEKVGDDIVHVASIPAQEARFADFAEPLPDPLKEAIRDLGVARPWAHQAEAIDRVRRGEDVLAITPTASGKSLIYLVPTFEAALLRPGRRALYLFPTKALAQDQLQGVLELSRAVAGRGGLVHVPATVARQAGLPGTGARPVSAAIYDGDTPDLKRRKIKADPPDILITNPAMLHLGLLAHHDDWRVFFENLNSWVIDEMHVSPDLGSHCTTIRRL
jgi:3-hydroxybutyryl-CoA dehydrogenase